MGPDPELPLIRKMGHSSDTRHPKGEGDEVELLIMWDGMEPGQGAFTIADSAEGFSLFKAIRWVEIRLVAALLKPGK